ncbi:MAG: M16 family metallopeptidase [bacterium]
MKILQPPLRHHKIILDNGLRVITVEMLHLHSLEISMYIKVGSRFETAHNNGISHFLEHMLFRGPKGMFDSYHLHRQFEALGGDINAFTTNEYTCFWLTLHPQYLAKGMSLFSEIFLSPNFTDIEVEKQIVLEEILNEQNEKGEDINIDDLSSSMLWPGDSLGLPTLGSRENLLRFTEYDARSFFNTYYTASNMVLCIAGRVKHNQVITYAQKFFTQLPKGQEMRISNHHALQKEARTLFKRNPGSQATVQICFRTVSYHSPDYYLILLLRRILDDGNSSLLQWNIREKQGLVYDISAAVSSYYDTGTFDIDFSAAPQKIPLVVKQILFEIRKLTTAPVSREEFHIAKRRYLMEFDFAMDSMGRMADRFGWSELFRKTESLEEERKIIEMVTREQIFDLCRRCFINSGLNIAVIGQYTKKEEIQIKKIAMEFP